MTYSLRNLINLQPFNTATVVEIHCPNCGGQAERHHLMEDAIVRTQCPSCDYLMITCMQTGKVIEAYAPGIYAK